MSETRRKDKFRQADDYDPTHDDLFVELLGSWKSILPTLPGFPEKSIIEEGKIVGEAILQMHGVPTMFPDALATVRLSVDHRDVPVRFNPQAVEYSRGRRVGPEYECSVEGCETWDAPEAFEFEKDPGSAWGDADARDRHNDWEKRREEAKARYLDRLKVPRRWKNACAWGWFVAVFEVKAEIKSLGEILRQLRLYDEASSSPKFSLPGRSYGDRVLPRGRVVALFTPDTRFDDHLRGQGFPVIHPSGTRPSAGKSALEKADALWESLGVDRA